MRVLHANRLARERSPYLLQHCHDPVDWFPWGDEAFAKARREDKPVFLSIGYSACHWCHVMERESFSDDEVARALNGDFVSVKVDREERPDVDGLYMAAVQALGQQGGWPLSVWLTPDLKPFMGGTYFPKESFLALLRQVRELWQGGRGDVLDEAAEVARYLEQLAAAVRPGPLDAESLWRRACVQLAQDYDPVCGGFMDAPKFPQATVIRFLLRRHLRTGEAELLAMAEKTLRGMAAGGICDQLGGGFHRYATDSRWLVPHFEKMLYDNALLAAVYLEAYQVTRREEYARVARETLGYVLRDLAAPEGGFFCSEDADSEGVEGRFYVWTPGEVREALGDEDGELFCRAFGVTPEGNWEPCEPSLPRGRSVLHAVLEGDFTRLKRRLLRARRRRPRPGRDIKVLTAWNALMVSALAKGAQTLGSPRYAAEARRVAWFLLERRLRDGRLWRAPGVPACLEDYAYLAAALLDLHELDREESWRRTAARLVEQARESFWDERGGGFFSSAGEEGGLFVRLREDFEGALPSANAALAQAFLRLHALTGEASYRERAVRTLESFHGPLERFPSGHPSLLCALDLLESGIGRGL
ncbi:MAG: thioredoxin domain-containing protein [Elusimicrobia bacterium]|nr:thioredoxin domain-containing protein [Elusimicrobiota bacterium]